MTFGCETLRFLHINRPNPILASTFRGLFSNPRLGLSVKTFMPIRSLTGLPITSATEIAYANLVSVWHADIWECPQD